MPSVADITDQALYPLASPGSPAWDHTIAAARQALGETGCCVLRDFVPVPSRETLREECASLAGKAY